MLATARTLQLHICYKAGEKIGTGGDSVFCREYSFVRRREAAHPGHAREQSRPNTGIRDHHVQIPRVSIQVKYPPQAAPRWSAVVSAVQPDAPPVGVLSPTLTAVLARRSPGSCICCRGLCCTSSGESLEPYTISVPSVTMPLPRVPRPQSSAKVYTPRGCRQNKHLTLVSTIDEPGCAEKFRGTLA